MFVALELGFDENVRIPLPRLSEINLSTTVESKELVS